MFGFVGVLAAYTAKQWSDLINGTTDLQSLAGSILSGLVDTATDILQQIGIEVNSNILPKTRDLLVGLAVSFILMRIIDSSCCME